ncbi:MAG TPA: aspartate dehydrogenase domain-containing protein [Acidimicrobiales bacterium]
MTAITLIGRGAIGGAVAAALAAGAVPGARHVATILRDGACTPDGRPLAPDAAVAAADLVVEAAGPEAVDRWGPAVVAAGKDLLVVSVGALVADGLVERLRAGPGRILVSSGAIGGLDLIRAAARAGAIRSVRLTTVKPAAALGVAPADPPAGPTADPSTAGSPAGGTPGAGTPAGPPGPVEVFAGTARDAVVAHPRSLNVAATLALACGSWDAVEVRLLADPAATANTHTVEVDGEAGTYRLEARNRPSPTTPTTSGVTAAAVLRAIADRTAPADQWSFA